MVHLMQKLILFLAAIIFGYAFGANETFPFYVPWNDTTSTVTSLSGLIDRPAGASGFIKATADGHLATIKGRIRLFGVNFCYGANFPLNADADLVAAHMAKFGINAVRFHHMDDLAAPDGIWTTTSPDRALSTGQLSKLDYLINRLKQNGIYSDLNLVVSRPFNRGSDLPAAIDSVADSKIRAAIGFFDRQVLGLQKNYARDLLTHVNPYTGYAYANEPALAFIEINNENGLIQAFLSTQLDSLPGYYTGELQRQWNDWLFAKYKTQAQLLQNWHLFTTPAGAEMLVNGSFTAATVAPWLLEQHETAVAAASITSDGPNSQKSIRIDISAVSSAGWHVQLGQGGLRLDTNKAYTLSFWAKASAGRTINVAVSQAHDPWANLGFSSSISLTTSWQQFTDTITVSAADTNGRVIFSNMGLQTGSVWISGVSLKPGGSIGLYSDENLDTRTIRRFLNDKDPKRTSYSRKDWFRFLSETESNYWSAMKNFIKDSLGCKSLVFGTIVGCSTPNILSDFDVVDGHAYWQHPSFPTTPWSSTDWYIKNMAMVNHVSGATLTGLSMKRILNKPQAITEYNHPNPNTYQAETFLFLSTYAGFQDWDAVFGFAFSHRRDDWNAQKASNFFDIDQNPVKLASLVPAAASFLRSDISPAQKSIVVKLDRETEIDKLLSTWAWGLVDAASVGVFPAQSLLHGVAIAVQDQAVPAAALAPADVSVSGTSFTSDTREIVWDTTTSSKGLLTVDANRTKWLVGFSGGKTIDLSGFVIKPGATLQNGFSAIAITAMDGSSFASATKLVITALGTEQNTGMSWYTYPSASVAFPPVENENVTVKNQWGNAPSLVEGINAAMVLPYSFDKVKVWNLSTTGARVSELPVVNTDGKAGITLSPSSNALWYEVQASAGSFITATFKETNTLHARPLAKISACRGNIVLSLFGGNNNLIQVFDSRGRVFASEFTGERSTYKIDTRRWPDGIYLVKVLGCGHQTVRRVVVVKTNT
jgi:hypothetical protein